MSKLLICNGLFMVIKSEVDGNIFALGKQQFKKCLSSGLGSFLEVFCCYDDRLSIFMLGKDRLMVMNYTRHYFKVYNIRTRKLILNSPLASMSMNATIVKDKVDLVLTEVRLDSPYNRLELQYLYNRKQYWILINQFERCICRLKTINRVCTQDGFNVNVYALKQSNFHLVKSIPLPLHHRIDLITHVGDDYLCSFVTANMPILLVIQISTCKVTIVNLDVKRDCDKSIALENNEKPEMMKEDKDLENKEERNEFKMMQVTPDTILNESDDIKILFYSLFVNYPYENDERLIRFTIDGELSPTVMLFTAYRIKDDRRVDEKRYKIDLLEICNMTVSNR